MEGSDDGLSDSARSWADDEQVRQQSMVVQQRIDQCTAAIHRHKMSIETLQYSISQDDFLDQHATDELEVLTVNTMHDFRSHAGNTPAVVLDRIARLKRRCLEGLGNELFCAVRERLQSLVSAGVLADAVRQDMIERLGLDKIGFYSLIDQIVYMECRWGHYDAPPEELD